MRRLLVPRLLLGALLLAGCTVSKPPPLVVQTASIAPDEHLPPYVRRGFEPFTRANAIGIARREWRGFGSLVNDAPPGSDPSREYRPDRQAGLWQRVADYWWSSQDAGTNESQWSSLYNESGTPYSAGAPAWSAAFISYVMRTAGAGTRFPYSPLHADYINAAARGEGVLHAESTATAVPSPGDLICYGRLSARNMQFEDLPATRFFGHCDIVVDAVPGQLTVIGGNVSAAVTMKHVPTTPQGTLGGPGGLVDGRYPWFVVVRVQYDA